MKAAQYVGNETFQVAETQAAPPGPGQVRVAPAFTGVCGTDLHIYRGHMDSRVTFPAVIGHEMSGVVESVGEGVTGWTVGQKVTVMPLDSCHDCPACRNGHTHVCQNLNFIGVDTAGSLQQLWNVPEEALLRLPDAVRLDHAALVEPTAVAVHDVRRAGLAEGEKAVVIGGGPIGVLIATVARHVGADVVVLELDETRRRAVEGLGFTTVSPRETDAEAWINEWTGGAGADVAFEVSGAAAAMLSATSLVRVRGRIVVVAIYPQPTPVNLHAMFWRELTLIGARVYEREDFETAIDLVADGVIPADLLITRIEPLENLPAAFEALAAGEAMKILIDCQT
ncbi:alcohol dehydrogenase catalytic domain-containing protein [Arthrobacter agilis]|uniref:zinc-dependent alcohol dehydrogenase n=1 Tax=Arthrobacter agilis TaxID=37921 RepID=UPI0023672951|nr:alcohol dehydrogenase catalytic domain-containing protein [Arthrobacter agilis]WDF34045.1 alcohol dehydrogenase catalytic domain-containing protein [Arthrobacter agilis]